MTRHDDGISIRLTRPLWRAALHVVGDFAEGGLEGVLLLIFTPLVVIAAAYLGMWSGPSWHVLIFLLVGIGVIVFALVRLAMHEGGPDIAVRGGRVAYRDSKVQEGALRECTVSDVVAVESGDARPLIRKRGGNELLGGFDAIEIEEYRRLTSREKRCVTQTLRDAIGLAPATDDATGESIG